MSKKLKVLILHKRSSLETTKDLPKGSVRALKRFKDNHTTHYTSLKAVQETLRSHGVSFDTFRRNQKITWKDYTLAITVGGDGTFLEAAHHLPHKGLIVGVNSDPSWSVGRFCACDVLSFNTVLMSILKGCPKTVSIHKLRIRIPKQNIILEGLNDILFCHKNPAAMSRYEIKLGSKKEEHRSSGIWISSAAGSTGAIFSAGGKKLPLESRDLQYFPRELYHSLHTAYKLTGGMINEKKGIYLSSLMAEGVLFLDGCHIQIPIAFDQTLHISSSPNSIQAIHG